MKHLLTSTIIAVLITSLVAFSAISYQSMIISDQKLTIWELKQEIGKWKQEVRTLEEKFAEQATLPKEPIQPWDAQDWNQELIEFLPLEETIRSSFEGSVWHDYLARSSVQVEHNRYWQRVHLSAVHYMEMLD